MDSARNEYKETIPVYFAYHVKIINTLRGQKHAILISNQLEHEDLLVCRLVNSYRRFEGS
jgi:hypothetical protein